MAGEGRRADAPTPKRAHPAGRRLRGWSCVRAGRAEGGRGSEGGGDGRGEMRMERRGRGKEAREREGAVGDGEGENREGERGGRGVGRSSEDVFVDGSDADIGRENARCVCARVRACGLAGGRVRRGWGSTKAARRESDARAREREREREIEREGERERERERE